METRVSRRAGPTPATTVATSPESARKPSMVGLRPKSAHHGRVPTVTFLLYHAPSASNETLRSRLEVNCAAVIGTLYRPDRW
jgi:hypothetical protein